MKAYFVTGTDTEVGKSTVSVAVLAAACRRGLQAGCMKPVESGCTVSSDGMVHPHDAVRLLAATNAKQNLDSVCSYRFVDPIAPGVAAANEGVTIDLARIEGDFARLVQNPIDFVVVEGAGGALVPLSGRDYVIDIASRLCLPALIVARPSLGTINHTLLTADAVRMRGIDVCGVIFSSRETAVDLKLCESNAHEIEKRGVRYLGMLPFVPTLSDVHLSNERLAKAAEEHLPLDLILPRA